MKNVAIAATSGMLQSRSTTACTYAHIAKGEEMKKRKKLNFWRLLPKTAPYILAFLFWWYSNLSARETGIIIAASVTLYVIVVATVGAWNEGEKKGEKQ